MRLNRLRFALIVRIYAALPKPKSAIVATLTTGARPVIRAATLSAIRDVGFAHSVANSRLHFAPAADLLFGGLRWLLASIPELALRHPIKKWAAFGAFIGAFGYLLISGASIPSHRAFVMLGIVLPAVVLNRAPISMRLVVMAAAAILLMLQESIPNASFQLSFAAAAALVAFTGPTPRVWLDYAMTPGVSAASCAISSASG